MRCWKRLKTLSIGERIKTRLEVSTQAGPVVFDYRKAAFLPECETLLVADLHFEKGSYLQAKGNNPVPTYDTAETLDRLIDLISLYRPKRVAALGDSFHDTAAGDRLSKTNYEKINQLAQSVSEFVWILGNHDPDIPDGLTGKQEDHLQAGKFLLTHLPTPPEAGEVNICGHLHPKIRIRTRLRTQSRPCFAVSETRIILPSFGAYTGGLYIDHAAIADELSGERCYFATNRDGIIALAG